MIIEKLIEMHLGNFAVNMLNIKYDILEYVDKIFDIYTFQLHKYFDL